jgi:UDP-2-acetamido-2,6-beta-L-arabino-hexul-4-ose reductase
MKILVTGAKGFIGKNLIVELRNQKYEDIYEDDIDFSLLLYG